MSSADPVPPRPGVRPDRTRDTQPVRPASGSPPGRGWVGGPAAGGPAETRPAPAAAPPTHRRGPGWFSLAAVALAAALVGGGVVALVERSAQPAAALPVAAAGADTDPTPGASAAPQVPLAAAVDWGALAERVRPSVVSIKVASPQGQGEGTGVVIDKIGHVLTNDHVATGAGADAAIQVSLSDGRLYRAEIVGTDPSTDLAVLQLRDAPADLVPASFARSADVGVGQQVMAVGNPLGLSDTVTTGIISALNRPVATRAQQPQAQPPPPPPPFGQGDQDGQGPGGQGGEAQGTEAVVTNALQTDAAINPGNSGGPLVNVAGQVIGINSSIASLSGGGGAAGPVGSVGLGFAIPADEAKRISKELVTDGSATHAQLGISLETQAGTATADEATRQSATISAVVEGSPAAAAGLQVRDEVVAIDDVPTPGSESLVAIVREHAPGDKVVLTVVRDGQEQKITATLGQREE